MDIVTDKAWNFDKLIVHAATAAFISVSLKDPQTNRLLILAIPSGAFRQKGPLPFDRRQLREGMRAPGNGVGLSAEDQSTLARNSDSMRFDARVKREKWGPSDAAVKHRRQCA